MVSPFPFITVLVVDNDEDERVSIFSVVEFLQCLVVVVVVVGDKVVVLVVIDIGVVFWSMVNKCNILWFCLLCGAGKNELVKVFLVGVGWARKKSAGNCGSWCLSTFYRMTWKVFFA